MFPSAAGLLLGAPALPKTGLSPARSSQRDARFRTRTGSGFLSSSRRTIKVHYEDWKTHLVADVPTVP
ncbi:MAG TPA: hypothetical protein VK491_00220, partial [Gemmatimonadaceae bacterium]|nr:hypothetical protein [Gemmatimonadaceae bacterium]